MDALGLDAVVERYLAAYDGGSHDHPLTPSPRLTHHCYNISISCYRASDAATRDCGAASLQLL